MNALSKPRAVLFDWDGTLVDSFAPIMAAYNHVRAHFGEPPMTEAEVQDAMTIGTARQIFLSLYGDAARAQEALDIYYGHMAELRAAHLQFIEGAADFVTQLRAWNIPTGVVSNMSHPALIEELTRINWRQHFDVVIGAGEAPRGKPSPDPIWLAIERLGMGRRDAPDVWYVGDMETDAKASHLAGTPFVLYSAGISRDEMRKGFNPRYEFSSYNDLLLMTKRFFDKC